VALTVELFIFSDVLIDPVALQGEHAFFLEKIYGYPQAAVFFDVPRVNIEGWAAVGFLGLLGIGLSCGVLAFSLSMAFWIGEMRTGIVGCFFPSRLPGLFSVHCGEEGPIPELRNPEVNSGPQEVFEPLAGCVA
jgi:hypothetical protein